MSKHRKAAQTVSPPESEEAKTGIFQYVRTHIWVSVVILVLALLSFAGVLKYLEEDAARELARNTKERSMISSVNPFMPAPTPAATPQFSKAYIYAGSRLLAVEDANASGNPPADLAVWRPSDGTWYVMGGPGSTETSFPWGMQGDQPAPGDYDGDGKTDFAIYRADVTGYWWVIRSSDNTYYSMPQGTNGDLPVPGDYDGDGKTDLALFRSSNQFWYVIRSSDQATTATHFGSSGDKTAQGDFDGDGKTDATVWRPAERIFYTKRSSDGNWFSVQVGSDSGDTPVPADYDGDGKSDFAVRSSDVWLIRSSASGAITPTSWGVAGDIPVQNDYDGDGRVDIACWRPSGKQVGRWSILNSHDSSTRIEIWGTTDDIPVPAFYRR
jgi:hypothetical protein